MLGMLVQPFPLLAGDAGAPDVSLWRVDSGQRHIQSGTVQGASLDGGNSVSARSPLVVDSQSLDTAGDLPAAVSPVLAPVLQQPRSASANSLTDGAFVAAVQRHHGGPGPQDDTVSLGALPGSAIDINRGHSHTTFGDDPPTQVVFNNVTVTDDGTGAGTISAAQSDITLPSGEVPYTIPPGVTVHIDYVFRPQSGASGTYDRNTGSATLGVTFDVYITSRDAPGFDNTHCIIPAVTVNMSTGNPGGAAFSGGQGTLVDNTFTANAIPTGACGGTIVLDYATEINNALGLPSLNPGDNTLTSVTRMTPPLAP